MFWKRCSALHPGIDARGVRHWFQRASLWQRIALTLLPPLLLVTSVELWMTRHDALEAANAAYDRSVLGALKSIDANISIASGGLSTELPYAMFEFFEMTANGQVFFRVATSDGLVELGSADLPLPADPLAPGVPVFYDAAYFGESVRFAALQRELDRPPSGSSGRSVLVQVGESTKSRDEFTARFVRRAASRDALILLLLAAVTAGGVVAALRPLRKFAQDVASRSPDDLTRIEEHAIPADIRPLVSAVNQHMGRTTALVAQQRQFLDDASHQLRTHLTTLQMQVDYAVGEDDIGEMKMALEAMRVEIGRVTRTTQQLLALGRSDTVALSLEAVDLGTLVREVTVGLLPMARAKDIDLGIETPSMPAGVLADKALMREALGNLVVNAIAYTDQSGTVTVRAGIRAQQAFIAVEDDGPGLSADECAELGRRFTRGKRAAQGGSGLGLAIARSIAERHGGSVELSPRASSTGLQARICWPAPSLLLSSHPNP